MKQNTRSLFEATRATSVSASIRTCICVGLILFVGFQAIWYPAKGLLQVKTDFALRYHEVQCLRSGINPFDVYKENVLSDRYHPVNRTSPNPESVMVHAYPPWEYSYIWPLTYLELHCAAWAFNAIDIVAFILCIFFAFRQGFRHGSTNLTGVLAAAFFLFSGKGLSDQFQAGNYSWCVLAALFSMCALLNKNRQIEAGFCLALAMTKPQMTLLFVIPLLLNKKFCTVITGAVICLSACIPPAIALKCSPIELILEIREIGNAYVTQTLILPQTVFRFLETSVCAGTAQITSCFLIILICCCFTMRIGRSGDWLCRCAPAALLAPSWTYIANPDTVIYGWTCLVLFLLFLDDKSIFHSSFVLTACVLLASSYVMFLSPNYTLGKVFFSTPIGIPPHLGTVHQTLSEIVRWLQRGGTILALYLLWMKLGNRTKQLRTNTFSGKLPAPHTIVT